MIIKLKRGRRAKSEHGYVTNEEMQEICVPKTCFQSTKKESDCACEKSDCPEPKHIITIPFKKHIHPCNEGLIECYDGEYYNTDKKTKIHPCTECC